jgi:hypothetical protein
MKDLISSHLSKVLIRIPKHPPNNDRKVGTPCRGLGTNDAYKGERKE